MVNPKSSLIQRLVNSGNHLEFKITGKDGVHVDGSIGMTLKRNNTLLAVSSIEFGLDDYYGDEVLQWPHDLPQDYFTAMEHSQGRWGLVQMQAMRGRKNFLEGISYKKIFMDAWTTLQADEGFDISFYLPARLNKWIVSGESPDQSLDRDELKKPLLKNYDSLAEKHGYLYNPDSKLFEK